MAIVLVQLRPVLEDQAGQVVLEQVQVLVVEEVYLHRNRSILVPILRIHHNNIQRSKRTLLRWLSLQVTWMLCAPTPIQQVAIWAAIIQQNLYQSILSQIQSQKYQVQRTTFLVDQVPRLNLMTLNAIVHNLQYLYDTLTEETITPAQELI